MLTVDILLVVVKESKKGQVGDVGAIVASVLLSFCQVILVAKRRAARSCIKTVDESYIGSTTCYLEAACLNSRNEQVITQAVAKYPYRYDNATNTPISNRSIPFTKNQILLLDAFDDEYDGVIVNPEKLPFDTNIFASVLHLSISIWRTQGKKGIWLKLPLEKCDLVPIAVKVISRSSYFHEL
ncbi:NUDIX hydrolase 8-like protein [Tanacetum coccineum]